ncbi:MAG: hypothetical protein II486_01905, partial [Thermoguttaceae bacterium]|nr:hypothetical protein [Thermoguttaceae bacterium]
IWAFYFLFSRRLVPFGAASRREPDVSSGWAPHVVGRGRGAVAAAACALGGLLRGGYTGR